MERNFKRISEELKLPQESRERIRSHLISCQVQQKEDIPVKKPINIRVPLIIAAIVAAMALTLTAGAGLVHRFRNDIIVSSTDDIPDPAEENTNGAPSSSGIAGPAGYPPSSLEEISENDRFKSNDWEVGERIGGGVMPGYTQWDFAQVLSSDPALRSRRVGRADGAEKMEYTAEDPTNLLDTLTGRVMIDLSWMNDQYDYVPDANMSYVVTDKHGNYVSELLYALYAKPDGSGYVRVEIRNTAHADLWGQSYIIDGSYETAYYYTTPDGYEFLIKLHKGQVWVDCNMGHGRVSLFGAYLSTDEIEDILDHLSLSVSEE